VSDTDVSGIPRRFSEEFLINVDKSHNLGDVNRQLRTATCVQLPTLHCLGVS